MLLPVMTWHLMNIPLGAVCVLIRIGDLTSSVSVSRVFASSRQGLDKFFSHFRSASQAPPRPLVYDGSPPMGVHRCP